MNEQNFQVAGKYILMAPPNKPLERCKKCGNLFYEFQRPFHELSDGCIGEWGTEWIDCGPIK